MNKLLIILRKEIKELFRDKKSLAMMLVIPFFIPLVIIGMSALFESEINKSVEENNTIGFAYKLDTVEENIASMLNINVITSDYDSISSMYQENKVDLIVTKEDNNYVLYGQENETTSYAISLFESFISEYKTQLQNIILENNDINQDAFNNIITYSVVTTNEDNYFKSYIINYSFFFIIMAITIASTYPSTDTTAGEKERGTLETLLTFPIKSKDIILGKYLSVSLSSIITGLISFILMICSLKIANGMFDIYKDIDLMLSLPSIIYSMISIIVFSLLISGLCIAISSKCKSFKEAQSALTPLNFISFFPGMIAFMANVKSSAILSLVPFLNYTLLFKDITDGNVNILNILLMILSSFIIIFLVLHIIIKQYKSEKVLF